MEQIYRDYTVYYQSGGIEQAVYEKDTGKPCRRSSSILMNLAEAVPLPKRGRLLDVGCGNGSLLLAFAHLFPEWVLAGTELSDRNRPVVESLPGTPKLYTCPIGEVPGPFDLIAAMHVVEHLTEPVSFLERVGTKLGKEGLLLIQVPDYSRNPFDLLIADHCLHLTPETLHHLITRSGFTQVALSAEWVQKEISVVVTRNDCSSVRTRPGRNSEHGNDGLTAAVIPYLTWIDRVRQVARALASRGPIGLFGSSIAATWLYGDLGGEAVQFFVDEDPDRIGRNHRGRPIYAPDKVPEGSHIFVALPRFLAESLVERLSSSKAHYHLPPAL